MQNIHSLLKRSVIKGVGMYYQHDINPVFFSLGPFINIHWYGMMYVIAFFLGWAIARYLSKLPFSNFSKNDVEDLITYVILGVILGGRIGYILFYDLSYYLSNPLDMLKIWQGGMSFHGGFAGVLLVLLYWAHKNKKIILN